MLDLLYINMVCMVCINFFIYLEYLLYRSCGVGYYVGEIKIYIYVMIFVFRKFII